MLERSRAATEPGRRTGPRPRAAASEVAAPRADVPSPRPRPYPCAGAGCVAPDGAAPRRRARPRVVPPYEETSPMRGSVLVVAVVAVLGLTACSEQPPEVAVNDQVPADQRVVEATDGEEGGGGGATGEVTGRFVGNQSLEFTEAPSEL